MRSRVGAVLALLWASLLLVTACGPGGDPSAPLGDPTTTTQPEPVSVVIEPGDGAQGVSPTAPISVTAQHGTFEQPPVLTNAAGEQVAGHLSEDRTTWTVSEPLGYGKTYTWSGTAVGADGSQAPVAGRFTTVNPSSLIGARLNVADGATYGVAMPIAVTFDAPVTDKAAVERALTVSTSPLKVEGSWAWLDDHRVHWRPREYWPANTQVHLDARLYGVAFGNGAYGEEDLSASFTIGREQIVRGNTQTHRLRVFRNGVEIANYPASYGLDSVPDRVTRSGTHVVMAKHQSYSMCNPKFGYCNVVVPYAVRISNNGEFIHGYAPSMWAQGNQNVSHGCINLSPARAQEFMAGTLIGDPVEIVGSSVPLSAADGDYYDWTFSWQEWQSMSAIEP